MLTLGVAVSAKWITLLSQGSGWMEELEPLSLINSTISDTAPLLGDATQLRP